MEEFYLKSKGTIVYDPYRPGLKSRNEWWCVLNVDKEITRYYRWWLSFERHIHILPPSWDAHISIIRGEKPRPKFMEIWKKYNHQKIEFEYKHGIVRVDRSQRVDEQAINAVGGFYYFIDVRCSRLDEIRAELGLRTGYSYHLTIGRTYEYEARKPKR